METSEANGGTPGQVRVHSPLQENPTAEALTSVLASRHSCRAFLPAALPHETIVRALDMAQLTASWCNVQPWNVIVVSGHAVERFRTALFSYAEEKGREAPALPESDLPFPTNYDGVYKTRQRETGWRYYGSVGIEKNDRAASARQARENFRLFGAPHFMLVTTPRKIGVYGAVDCGAYVGNFLLAAESLGFSAVAQAAIAMFSPFVRDHFGLSDDHLVVCGVSFGREDQEHLANAFRIGRADLSENVTFVEE